MQQSEILIRIIEKTALIIVLFIGMTKIRLFKDIFQKEEHKTKDLLLISMIFTGLGIVGTYSGIDVKGSLANTRIIAIVSGGIMFGPIVGITSGFLSGFHRYIIDIGGVTALPCFISSTFAGILSGFLHKKIPIKYQWVYGIICGVISESISMILIYMMSTSKDIAIEIISKIYVPMIIGQVGIGFLVSIVRALKKQTEEMAAFQSQLALDIANKTLPYFRSINEDSLIKVCEIIKTEINSDAVSITDTESVLAYVGVGEEYFKNRNVKISQMTKDIIEKNEIANIHAEKEKNIINEHVNLKTALIIPLTDSEGVVGSLKIYYTKRYEMSHSKKTLAIGLSHIISTLMEISKIEKIQKEKNKAEIKALQTQINPHFLFNALNTITSFIRIHPNKARELIVNLSTYMRYNLEVSDNLIEVNKEIEQVKSYVEIEKARFGDKLKVIYDIDENIDVKMPSLIIQPLVENAIIHGIRENGGEGTVRISIKKHQNEVRICVENNGNTIDEDVIHKVYNDNMPENKIGLYNVHLRLKLIYGKGVNIEQLHPGTKIEFDI